MSRITIDENWIRKLNDEASCELIARLCRAELARVNLDESLVTWGGNQRAPDGGIDVNVKKFTSTANEYIHLSAGGTVFQVKAEQNFGPAKVESEMKPKGVIRDFFAGLNQNSGAYLIASAHEDLTQPLLINRLNKMKEVLASEDLSNVRPSFLDARQLADWVERHISVQIWLREKLNLQLDGWHTYGPWANGETDIKAAFHLDKHPRIMPPDGKSVDDRLTLLGAIKKIRSALIVKADKQTRLRLVGLSGVGKTRLVQALFDERIEAGVLPSTDQVIYTDAGFGSDPSVHKMVSELMNTNQPAIVIVDNCGSKTHGQLVESMKHAKPEIRLLTIEFDIQDDLPVGTDCYQIEAASSCMLKSVLKDKYEHLSDLDARRIAQLSDGNARIAIALADGIKNTNNVGELKDAQLFKRLFHQRDGLDSDELIRTAEATSLVYSFNINEIEFIATYADLKPQAFKRNVAKLRKKGLVQQRGNFRALLPHALANRFASEALSLREPEELYEEFFQHAPVRIAISFAYRLSFLHDCDVAVQVSKLAFGEEGICFDLSNLNEDNKKIFRYLAATNPTAALVVIEKVVETGGPITHDLYSLLFNLAYDEHAFDRVATVLAKLLKPLKHMDDNDGPKKFLTAMYGRYFSGTMAQTPQKLAFLERMLNPIDLDRSDLALACLDSALKCGHFSSGNSFAFGGHSRSYGWTPKTSGDVAKQYSVWLNKLIDIALKNEDLSQKAREILAKRFAELWRFHLVRPYLSKAVERLIADEPWPEGYHALMKTLRFGGDKPESPDAAPLRELILKISPSNLVERVRANVIVVDMWGDWIDEDGTVVTGTEAKTKRVQSATTLGEEIGNDLEALNEVRLALILKTQYGYTKEFGNGVGKTIISIPDELERIRGLIENCEIGTANYDYPLGLLKAWKAQDPVEVIKWLNKNEYEPVWRIVLPWIVNILGINQDSLEQLISLLAEDQPPVDAFDPLTLKGLIEPLLVNDRRRLFDALIKTGPQGALIGLEHVFFEALDRDIIEESYKAEMMDFLIHFPWEVIDDPMGQVTYKIEKIFKKFVEGCSEIDAIALIDKVSIKPDITPSYAIDIRLTALREMFRYFSDLCLRRFCMPNEDGNFDTIYRFLQCNTLLDQHIIEVVTDDALLNWLDGLDTEHKQAGFEFAAETGNLIEHEIGGIRTPIGFRPLASEIVKRTKNPEKVLKIFAERAIGSSFNGSIADAIRSRKVFFNYLELDNRLETRKGLDKALAYLDKRIASEQAWEDDRSKTNAERFE